MSSDIVLERLSRLHPKLIDLSLDRVEALLAKLGHPERHLAPVVHVAGTNGKGSLIAYLRAIAEAGGWRVQAYTSPHLVRFHERIRLVDGLIDEADLVALLARCETVNGEEAITFFEVTTVAAFLAFAAQPADLLLLETGLGGRLDATNVTTHPRLCVITAISVDHVQFLGNSLASIAAEKAGILKPGVPAVIAPQAEEALAVIERRAAEVGAPLLRAGYEWRSEPCDGGFQYSGKSGRSVFAAPALPGPHQLANAGLAVACMEALGGGAIEESAIARGLAEAEWPGRLQRLHRGPLLAGLTDPWELWLDGGHNAAAGAALADAFGQWSDLPLHLVYGMLNNKDAQGFLRPLGARASSLRAVAIPGEANSLTAPAAAQQAEAAGFAARAAESVAAAVAEIKAKEVPGRILICGSLYLAGRILAENG